MQVVRRKTKVKAPVSKLEFYASLAQLTPFFDHCKELASSIIKSGTAVPMTISALKRRKSLGLPLSRFNDSDLKKLAIPWKPSILED